MLTRAMAHRHPSHGWVNSRDGDRGGRTGTLSFRYDYRQQ
jgi:hypothetical protein